MNRILNSAAVCVMAAVSAGAWADGEARMRPDPGFVSSGTPTPAPVAETRIDTPAGSLRVREGASDAAESADSAAPPTVSMAGPDGQRMRVVPGEQPEAVAGNSPLPADAVIVEVGGSRMLQIPGMTDVPQATDTAASPPAGMRIVDLSPGAIGPAGMPAPMTLYRVSSGTVSKD